MRQIIMVVDDEADIVDFITGLLEDEGYTAIAFTEGEPALDHARLQPPALALIDLLMPRMDGRELIAGLRREVGAEMPILAMSASSDIEDLHELPIQDYISKPFDLDELLARVQSLLSGHTPSPHKRRHV